VANEYAVNAGHSTGDYVTINIGPSHPAMHGTLRVIAQTDGETVVKADPEIGYLHRGVEKLGEHLTYHQFIPSRTG